MQRDKIYQQLNLEENAGLFIRKLETDAMAREVILHFLHEYGIYNHPKLTYFRITMKDCSSVELQIEDDNEVDNRFVWLRGTHDVIDIELGEEKLGKKFVLYATGFSLNLSYKSISIEIETE